jgi:hypothetical protein
VASYNSFSQSTTGKASTAPTESYGSNSQQAAGKAASQQYKPYQPALTFLASGEQTGRAHQQEEEEEEKETLVKRAKQQSIPTTRTGAGSR